MNVEGIYQAHRNSYKPLKAAVAVLSVTALVVGVLSILYQYNVVLALKGLGAPIGFTGAWVMAGVGSAVTVTWMALYFSSPKPLEKKAAKLSIAPSRATTVVKSTTNGPISYQMAPLKGDRLGKLAWAKNFCYASTVITSLFGSGDQLKEAYLNALKSELKPQVREFLTHLLEFVINPMRQGREVGLLVVEKCQRLAWEAGWNTASGMKRLDGYADAEKFRAFILRSINYKHVLFLTKSEMRDSWIGYQADLDKKKGSVQKIWKSYIHNWVRRHLQYKGGEIQFPSFTALHLERRINGEDFDTDLIKVEPMIPVQDLIPKGFTSSSPNQVLRLTSVFIFTNATWGGKNDHFYSFVRMKNGSWFKCDDLRGRFEKVSFKEVEEVAGREGRTFNYSLESVSCVDAVAQAPNFVMAPLKRDGLGKLAWATNFCYAASTLFALFGSGDYYKQDLLNALKSNLKPEVRAFLEHLLVKVLNPMRSGVDVPLEYMKECQRLAWEAGWKNFGLERLDSFGGADTFRLFLLECIDKPEPMPFIQGNATCERLWHKDGFLHDFENRLVPTLEDSWKLMIIRSLNEMREENRKRGNLSLKGPIIFPPFTTLELSRFEDQRYYVDPMPFKEEISSYDLIPEEFRPSKPQTLRLVSIVVNDPSWHHLWSYVRLQDGSWLHCDDLSKICKKVSYDEVQEVASKMGELFNYEIVPL